MVGHTIAIRLTQLSDLKTPSRTSWDDEEDMTPSRRNWDAPSPARSDISGADRRRLQGLAFNV